MLVLQVDGEACPFLVPEEAPCAAADYEAAVKELVKAELPTRTISALSVLAEPVTTYWRN